MLNSNNTKRSTASSQWYDHASDLNGCTSGIIGCLASYCFAFGFWALGTSRRTMWRNVRYRTKWNATFSPFFPHFFFLLFFAIFSLIRSTCISSMNINVSIQVQLMLARSPAQCKRSSFLQYIFQNHYAFYFISCMNAWWCACGIFDIVCGSIFACDSGMKPGNITAYLIFIYIFQRFISRNFI